MQLDHSLNVTATTYGVSFSCLTVHHVHAVLKSMLYKKSAVGHYSARGTCSAEHLWYNALCGCTNTHRSAEKEVEALTKSENRRRWLSIYIIYFTMFLASISKYVW